MGGEKTLARVRPEETVRGDELVRPPAVGCELQGVGDGGPLLEVPEDEAVGEAVVEHARRDHGVPGETERGRLEAHVVLDHEGHRELGVLQQPVPAAHVAEHASDARGFGHNGHCHFIFLFVVSEPSTLAGPSTTEVDGPMQEGCVWVSFCKQTLTLCPKSRGYPSVGGTRAPSPASGGWSPATG